VNVKTYATLQQTDISVSANNIILPVTESVSDKCSTKLITKYIMQ